MKKRPLFFIFLFLGILPAFGEYNRLGVPDSSDIRKTVAEKWFYDDLNALRHNRTEVRTNSVGQNFQVRLEETDSVFSVIVAPEKFLPVDIYTEKGVKKDIVAQYPADSAGSWIFIRDSATQAPLRIRYYFAADSEVYVQFSPNGKKSTADFIIDGCYAARGVPVGVPFERFYDASFADVLSLTEKSLPWNYAEIHPEQYRGSLQMISVIRKNLSRIRYRWDACYDENGDSVNISNGEKRSVSEDEKSKKILNLSSAGFVKWIVDGIVEPIVGSGLYLGPLLRPTISLNPLGYAEKMNKTDDLYFTLDWTRNLAAARLSIQTRKNYLYEDSGVDINIEPFTAQVTDTGISTVVGYMKNTGYEISKLKPLLYVLAVSEPTYFYLGAIRRKVPSNGTNPEYYVFDQTAVVLPYFDENGQFGCTIFENGREMNISQFSKKYKDCYIHLTRALSSDRFFPL
ncbi:MAG: hypothetical protein KBT11_00970 [Treponema sp.]|nr:hypothetical protein [Candidatus Treponema equifaecale]